jgi:hypothetical protein
MVKGQYDEPDLEPPSKESKPTNKKNALIGCGVLLVFAVIIAVVIGIWMGSGSTDTSTPSSYPTVGGDSTDTSTPISYPTVVYEITGTAKYVDVTLNNSTGGTEQYTNVPIPKRYTYNSFPDYFLYISAQNTGESGTVTVSIYVNGTLFKTSTSSGAYVIASASGMR